jgi:hypothetical protein
LEVAGWPGVIGVRDSKGPDGTMLRSSPPEWDAFLGGAYAGVCGR